MICEKCQKDVLDCPCDIEFTEPLLKTIKGNRCPSCEERVYVYGCHMCHIDDSRLRQDSTMCFKCYGNVIFVNNERLKIPNEVHSSGFILDNNCQCEEPDVR